MPNWRGFQDALNRSGQGAGKWAQGERERDLAWDYYRKQKALDLQNAMALERLKFQLDLQNPLTQFLNKGKVIDTLWKAGAPIDPRILQMGTPSMGSGQTIDTNGNVINLSPDQFSSMPAPTGTPTVPFTGTIPSFGAPSTGAWVSAPSGFKVKGFKGEATPFGQRIGDVNYEAIPTPEEEQREIDLTARKTSATELAKGIPTSEAGKVSLARESLQNIEDVKNILYPSGKPESYKRWTATGSNIPFSGLPFVPSNTGFYNPQTIFRKMGASLSGRQLIQTGVAARPEETLKLVRQFAPSGLSSAKSGLEALNELQDFYKTYLYTVDTKGLQAADEWAKTQPDLMGNVIGSKQGIQTFNVDGKIFKIPADKVDAFKKAKGLK